MLLHKNRYGIHLSKMYCQLRHNLKPMKFETRTVTHVDGKTTVTAKGKIINGEFIGEYKFGGLTYGVTIKI